MPAPFQPGRGARPRVLVLCRPYLGDLVLTGPVFRNLRAWLPDAWIAAGAYPESVETLSFFPEIDEVIAVPRRRRGGRLDFAREWAGTLRRVRRARFDLVYDLLHTDRSSLVTLASGATRRVGYVRDVHRLRHRVYSDVACWAAELPRAHTVDLFLQALVELGMPVRTRSIAVALTEAEVCAAATRLRALVPERRGPLLAVHPGAGTANRLWPAERFAAVCDHAQESLGAQVLLLGGPREAPTVESIRASMRTAPATLDGPCSVRELAALLQRADLLLGLDSGPVHLAAAVGTRTVAIFGAALPSQWRPLGEGHRVVRPPMPCDGCVSPAACRPPNPYHMNCVRRVAPDEVGEAVREQLRAAGGSASVA